MLQGGKHFMNGTCGKIPVLNGGSGRRRVISMAPDIFEAETNFLLSIQKIFFFRRLQLSDGIMLRSKWRKYAWFTWGKQ